MYKELLNKERSYFLPLYKRLPVAVEYGEGVHLFDRSGTRYLDLFSGLAVSPLGHCNPKIIRAVDTQIRKFSHISNYFITDVQIEFAEILLNYSGMDKIFLCNSGTEAAEAAFKLIRKLKGEEKIIFSLTGAFHGRTYAALSLSGNPSVRKRFSPLLPGTDLIEFNNNQDLVNKINANTAAVFIEFIQGEGGINVVKEEFIKTLGELRNKYNYLIIEDAVQSGAGRTGKAFANMHYNLEPDILLTAKSIGGGLPLGAVCVKDNLSEVFDSGDHGSTFGGNPVSCAAGMVVLKEIFENGLLNDVIETGDYLIKELLVMQNMFPDKIKEIRGKGLMIGIEMRSDIGNIIPFFLSKNILINITKEKIIRLLPPFIISKEDIDYFLYTFHEYLKS